MDGSRGRATIRYDMMRYDTIHSVHDSGVTGMEWKFELVCGKKNIFCFPRPRRTAASGERLGEPDWRGHARREMSAEYKHPWVGRAPRMLLLLRRVPTAVCIGWRAGVSDQPAKTNAVCCC